MKTARDLMTWPAQTLSPNDSLADAARRLADEGVGSMPVVEGGRVVGVVTDRDIVVSGLAQGLDVNQTPVSQIASTEVVTVSEDDSAQAVAQTLADHQIRRVPVLDDGGEVVGVVSQADVARELDTEQTGEVVKEISQK